jgi:hypothetical protein
VVGAGCGFWREVRISPSIQCNCHTVRKSSVFEKCALRGQRATTFRPANSFNCDGTVPRPYGGTDMTYPNQTGSTALGAGASRVFSRIMASVGHAEGAQVVAVARGDNLPAQISRLRLGP